MPEGTPTGKKVLVVDDDRAVQRLLQLILTDRGFQVTVAPTAEEAEVLARREAFDVIVLDKNLPRMSGLEVVPRLRAIRPGASFALITAEMTTETPARLREAGVDAILTKPFVNPAAVADRVAALALRP